MQPVHFGARWAAGMPGGAGMGACAVQLPTSLQLIWPGPSQFQRILLRPRGRSGNEDGPIPHSGNYSHCSLWQCTEYVYVHCTCTSHASPCQQRGPVCSCKSITCRVCCVRRLCRSQSVSEWLARLGYRSCCFPPARWVAAEDLSARDEAGICIVTTPNRTDLVCCARSGLGEAKSNSDPLT